GRRRRFHMGDQMRAAGILVTGLGHMPFIAQPHQVAFAAAARLLIRGRDDALLIGDRRAITKAASAGPAAHNAEQRSDATAGLRASCPAPGAWRPDPATEASGRQPAGLAHATAAAGFGPWESAPVQSEALRDHTTVGSDGLATTP